MEKVYGLIGSPVSHSMSADMHNDLFSYYNLKARYHAFDVSKENLRDAVKGLRALGVAGFNITIPHKVAMLDLLDEVEEVAANIGAVNTVINNQGKLIGYNTDGDGYIESLKRKVGKDLRECTFLLIGAGGAARGIFISLAAQGIKEIDICNRTVQRAEELIDDCRYHTNSSAISPAHAEQSIAKYDVIINTTSVGMYPKVEESPLSLAGISQNTVVSDIIYNPLKTLFLQEAERNGATIDDGVGMFVNQGALAFQRWTGIYPDTSRMEKLVYTRLGG